MGRRAKMRGRKGSKSAPRELESKTIETRAAPDLIGGFTPLAKRLVLRCNIDGK